MPSPRALILGEFSRRLDERYRLSLPIELLKALTGFDPDEGGADPTALSAMHRAAGPESSTRLEGGNTLSALERGEEASGRPFEAILAKERPGALSLWNAAIWNENLEAGIALVERKMLAGKLEGRWDEVQSLGRLLSTRQRAVSMAGRGRIVIPEGFREFLAVPPGEEVLLVGAGVCIEIWQPQAWHNQIAIQMPEFRQLFDRLSQ